MYYWNAVGGGGVFQFCEEKWFSNFYLKFVY